MALNKINFYRNLHGLVEKNGIENFDNDNDVNGKVRVHELCAHSQLTCSRDPTQIVHISAVAFCSLICYG